MKKPDINFDSIQKAMEDTDRDAFDYYFDLRTGDVVILSEDIITKAREILCDRLDEDLSGEEEIEFDEDVEIPDWIEGEVDLALDIFLINKDRYVRIPERSPAQAFTAMKSFIPTLEDSPLANELSAILDGPGAFRRFKDALGPHPKARKQWHKHNAAAVRAEIKEWLHQVYEESVTRAHNFSEDAEDLGE